MNYLLPALLLLLCKFTHAATYNDPVAMLEIPELKMHSFLKFTNNYMFRGQTQSNDQGSVQAGFNLEYGENVNIFIQGSSVNMGTTTSPATMEIKLRPQISTNFGRSWHKLYIQYVNATYPNYTSGTWNYVNAIQEFYFQNFTPYVKISKQLDGDKLQYSEGGLIYTYNDFFAKVLYSKYNSKITSLESTSVLNGKNSQASFGYKWQHYTFSVSTNRFRKDPFPGNTATTTKTTWVSIAYNS